MFGVARLAWVKRLSDEDKVDFLKTQMLFVENLKKQMQAKLWQKEPSCCAGSACKMLLHATFCMKALPHS